jgi:hypothetical protein
MLKRIGHTSVVVAVGGGLALLTGNVALAVVVQALYLLVIFE